MKHLSTTPAFRTGLTFLWVSAAFCLQTFAETPPRLENLTERFQRELTRIVEPLDQKFVNALVGMQRDYSSAQNLDAALIIKSEIDRIREGAPVLADLESSTAELDSLRESYAKAVARDTETVIERYKNDLRDLQGTLTTANLPEEASLVRERLQKIEETPVVDLVAKTMPGGASDKSSTPLKKNAPLVDWLQDHELYWEGRTASVVIQFEGDDAIVFANGTQIMEKPIEVIDENTFTFDWSSGDLNTFRLDERRNSFTRHMAKTDESGTGSIRNR